MITFAMIAYAGGGDIGSILIGIYALLLMADAGTGL